MKVYTGSQFEGGGTSTGRAVVLVRRVGLSVGLLFGFGLLALLMAGRASAEGSRQDGDDAQPRTERSLLDVVDPVTHSLGDVLSQTVDSAAPLVEPVVEVVTPIVEATAPVTEPLVGPLVRAVEPVTRAVGLGNDVSDVSDAVPGDGGQRIDAPGRVVPEVWSVPPMPSPLRIEHRAAVSAVESPARSVVMAHVVSVSSTQALDARQGDELPTVPAGPVSAVPGGSGSVGGSAGAHGADSVVLASAGSMPDDNGSGRGPPGTEASHPWLGYDRPDCPS